MTPLCTEPCLYGIGGRGGWGPPQSRAERPEKRKFFLCSTPRPPEQNNKDVFRLTIVIERPTNTPTNRCCCCCCYNTSSRQRKKKKIKLKKGEQKSLHNKTTPPPLTHMAGGGGEGGGGRGTSPLTSQKVAALHGTDVTCALSHGTA